MIIIKADPHYRIAVLVNPLIFSYLQTSSDIQANKIL